MRRLYALILDVALAGICGWIGFRLAQWAAPCPQQGDCLIFAPLVILGTIVGLVLYVVVSQVRWGTTFGEHLFRLR